MSKLALIVGRDLRLALRQSSDSATVVMFFVITAVLFPFGVGPEPNMLARIAPGIVWVTALLAAMLSLERLFHVDYEDGTLDLLVLAPMPLELIVAAKCLAHWLTTGVPLILAAPLIGLLLNLDAAGYGTLIATLALGTPVLTLIGAVGAALTLGARRGGVLLSLLVLPLFVPALVFGAAGVEAAVAGLDPKPHLLILGGLALGALALAPIAAAAALRQAVE